MYENIAIIGSSGAIGSALVAGLAPEASFVHAFARESATGSGHIRYHALDYTDEAAIAEAASIAAAPAPLDLIIVATGILHDAVAMPEKSLRELSAAKFQHLFAVNTILPALVAKHFLPALNRNKRAVFAALSARVGSITDNQLGGWYAYRASKAALNMIIKNAAIETARRSRDAIVAGLHPGTVDSRLSRPFQSRVKPGGLFTPAQCAQNLIAVLNALTPGDSGRCFAWDGTEVRP